MQASNCAWIIRERCLCRSLRHRSRGVLFKVRDGETKGCLAGVNNDAQCLGNHGALLLLGVACLGGISFSAHQGILAWFTG